MQNDDDPKIASNVAVAEYYLRGATNPEDLLDALGKIRCVRPACARWGACSDARRLLLRQRAALSSSTGAVVGGDGGKCVCQGRS